MTKKIVTVQATEATSLRRPTYISMKQNILPEMATRFAQSLLEIFSTIKYQSIRPAIVFSTGI